MTAGFYCPVFKGEESSSVIATHFVIVYTTMLEEEPQRVVIKRANPP